MANIIDWLKANAGDAISSPVANFVYTLFASGEQQRAYDEALKANKKNLADSHGILDKLEKELGPKLFEQTKREEELARGARDEAKGRADFLAKGVGEGYSAREKDVLDYLKTQLPQLEQAYGKRATDVVGGFDASRAGIQGAGRDLESRVGGSYDALGRNLAGGYQNLEGRALEKAGTLGTQQKIDIDRAFKAKGAESQANLASRGLTGSTISSSVDTGIERERSAEQRRLQDDLTRQQLDIIQNVGGAGLGSQQTVGLAGAGETSSIGRENLGRDADMARMRTELEAALTGDTLQQKGLNVGAMAGAKADLSADRIDNTFNAGRYAQETAYGTGRDYLNTVSRGHDRDYANQFEIPDRRLNLIQSVENPYPNQGTATNLANQFGQNSPQVPEPETNYFAPTVDAVGKVGAAAIPFLKGRPNTRPRMQYGVGTRIPTQRPRPVIRQPGVYGQ